MELDPKDIDKWAKERRERVQSILQRSEQRRKSFTRLEKSAQFKRFVEKYEHE
jgi:hypothetical protein